MGMYTELVMGFELKYDTPQDVIDILHYLIEKKSTDVSLKIPDHKFFKTPRWKFVCLGSSYYFGFSDSHSIIKYKNIANNYIVSIRANIRNYDNEIELFIDWIKPYIDDGSGARKLIGYSIYEEAEEPTLYYLLEKEDV